MNIGLKGKLISAFLFAGLAPLSGITYYAYKSASVSLERAAFDKLVAVRNVKGEAVKRYFQGIADQMLTFSHDLMVVDAMKGFRSSFNTFNEENNISPVDIANMQSKIGEYYVNEFGKEYENQNGVSADPLRFLKQLDSTAVALQYHYIANNPNPLGSKEGLDLASEGSSYSKLHGKVHPVIREFLQKFGYYDIFLIDIDTGHIVYSVFKELDYATSLLTGPYSNTNFAEAFKLARDMNDRGKTVLVDYKKYTPSYESPASFIAAPVWDGSKKIGVAIFQMPIDRLNAIMGERSGMGKTGETYLFGQDKLMRSDSYQDKENYNVVSSFKKPKKGSLDSSSVDAVLSGKQGNKLALNYLGQAVLSAFAPIDIQGLKWGLVAEIGEAEAFEAANSLRKMMLLIVLGAVFAVSFLAWFIASRLASRIKAVAEHLADGSNQVSDSATEISAASSKLSEAATEQAASLQETVSSVDEISAMVQRNADSAEKSTSVSGQSTSAAEQGKQTVESMINSINEISQSNEEIMHQMQQSNKEISEIVTVISEIGEKTKVINDIVFQTKLLSFNASVEAARAGEHGKGFAVVAEEVGNLASMSGSAAKEISEMLEGSIKKVTGIVDDTKTRVENLVQTGKTKVEAGTRTAHECGKALDEILNNVSSVNEMVKEIASASNEQSQGIQEVTKAMGQLDQVTQQNTNIAQQSSVMSSELESQAHRLNSMVEELMGIVGASPNKERKRSKRPVESKAPSKNVLPFKAKQFQVEKKPVNANAKKNFATGGEFDVPSKDDDRFEEI